MNKDFSASALRYRPQKFQEVIGQDAIVKTLLNAIKNDSLAQALLFCGPRGVGKTTCACLLYTSPSPRDLSTSRMPSSA